MNRNFGTRFIPACALAAMAILMAACSDGKSDVAGGASGDMGIVAKDIAGLAQKGPFVKGSAVTVQGIDCKTMKFSDEVFEGKVKSDKGDFAFDDVTLSSTCAVFEATGKYRSEITGKESAGEITLHALTDLKDRKNVNINLLTELEYERVMYLVTERGKTFAEAKAQAEQEVLAAFGIAGDFDNSEDLTIYESGDGNAALLAVSVLMQAETDDAGLAKRIEKFADSFAETGDWNDDKTKATIEEWQVAATADGTLDSIRKNIEGWGYADVVPAFEKYIEVFGDTVILSSDSHQSSSSTPVEDLSSSSAKTNAGSEYDATANTLKDLRDGKVYKTVKIGDQVWMAENLNFETDSSFCYRDSAYFCAMHGRLYKWTAAVDACPSGWHLPSKAEFESLIATVGEDSTAGKVLKSASGWSSGGNGSDDFGFAALPAGDRGHDGGYSGAYFLAFFWSSTEINDNNVFNMYLTFDGDSVHQSVDIKDMGNSVRCVKDDGTVPESSSGVTPQSSSSSKVPEPVEGYSSSSVTLAVPCKTETEDNCEYGTLTDERDGQTYKTVKIGDQVWMAENLNYSDSAKTASLKGKSWCYDNDSDNCVKYGRLYTWAAAIDSVKFFTEKSLDCGYGKTCALPDTVQGICPSGWRLPRKADWETLFSAVGGQGTAGKILKTQTGWNNNGNGMDAVGFSGWPAGDGNGRGSSNFKGDGTYFWSSTESSEHGAYFVSLYYRIDSTFLNHNDKDYAYSVRCVKESVGELPSSSVVSSSSVASSSSIAMAAPCKTESEDNCEYGTLTDNRDGQTYKTVKIGDQIWMAENLNYAYLQPTDSLDSSSFCYNDSLEYCEKYGRLYTWAAAVDSAGLFTSEGKGCGYYAQCTFTKHIRGVCPDGWHVPDTTEWQTLIAMVSGDRMTAGRLLKSSSGWNKYSDEIDGNGVDAFGFAVLPAGYREARGQTVPSSGTIGSFTKIWTATDWNDDLSEYGNEVNGGLAYYYFMRSGSDGMGNNLDYKTSAYPVRCVKD
ncbi:MAG: fibrobacter succinogenes major paralogous domain-containing protein [Fibrobacter sp.]|nr:fibrobacter succinogenes major paralogous domain-containing protein [Fibrobacter sp.]